ncbi:hypothetical protein BV210_05530 [Halorientalis sp. IM1011]|uniref:hypothetical protein n=1 Tax=Halorientalis sp. IM1011 TaxID=1932360 RepID=UPI00097CC7E9|nr:hypothetical protein [Halorientalis sp. IM1011]AQL42206.1 hypothetical protein BV210_05530 [Halorientalis sp. IM1011]
MADADAIPMSIDRPKLWIAGLVGILVLGGVIGLGLSTTKTEVVTISLQDTDGEVTVTITRDRDGEYRQVYRGTHDSTDSGGNEIWTTEKTGRYRIELSGENTTCTVRVTVQRRSGSLTTHMPSPPSECPADLRVGVRSRPA